MGMLILILDKRINSEVKIEIEILSLFCVNIHIIFKNQYLGSVQKGEI